MSSSSRPRRKAAPTYSLKDPFPEYQVDAEPESKRQKTRGGAAMEPQVTHHLNHNQVVAETLNVSEAQLETLKKLLNLCVKQAGTPEGDRADQKFTEALQSRQINRRDFNDLALDSGTDDLIKKAGNSSVTIRQKSPDASTVLLADSLSIYFAVKHYWDRATSPTRVHFYGPIDDCQLCSEMFLSTTLHIENLVSLYAGNSAAKDDYKKGLVSGFQEKCKKIAVEREKLIQDYKVKKEENENSNELSLTLASKYIISANIAAAVEEKMDGDLYVTRIVQPAIVADEAYSKGKKDSTRLRLEKQIEKSSSSSNPSNSNAAAVKVKLEPM